MSLSSSRTGSRREEPQLLPGSQQQQGIQTNSIQQPPNRGGRSRKAHHQNSFVVPSSCQSEMDSRFSCNICLDPVEEPVVTQCGHLYCWPCLFRWLEPGMTLTERQSLQLATATLEQVLIDQHQSQQQQDNSRRHCPVCKAFCCVSNLIPIYVRSTTQNNKDESTGGTAAAASSEKFSATQSNLSEIDDKHSSSSTIATEQEEDDEDDVAVRGTEAGGGDSSVSENVFLQEDEAVSHQPLLSIDTPPAEEDDSFVSRTAAAAPPAAALGAMRRQSPTTVSSATLPQSALVVPSRPSSSSHNHRPRSLSENAVGILQQQQDTNLSRTLALSQGLAMTLHRALQPTSSTNSTAQAAAAAAASVVPPLHRAEGYGNAAAMNSTQQQQHLQQESDPDATEFLSRILLMLASFVILCLLLF